MLTLYFHNKHISEFITEYHLLQLNDSHLMKHSFLMHSIPFNSSDDNNNAKTLTHCIWDKHVTSKRPIVFISFQLYCKKQKNKCNKPREIKRLCLMIKAYPHVQILDQGCSFFVVVVFPPVFLLLLFWGLFCCCCCFILLKYRVLFYVGLWWIKVPVHACFILLPFFICIHRYDLKYGGNSFRLK